MIIRIIPIKP